MEVDVKYFPAKLSCTLFILFLTVIPGGAQLSSKELAAESETYIRTTAKENPTSPATIITKVEEACALLEKEGPAIFPKFKGKDSPFIFEGTYIWIHRLQDAKMLMHPIKYKMEGNDFIDLRDEKGKPFFAVMNTIANEIGHGWVDYYWPIPGTKNLTRKVSYVKRCTMANGTEVVIGCGIYNGDQEAMAELDIR